MLAQAMKLDGAFTLPLLSFLAVIATWEIGGRMGYLNPSFFSYPTRILDAGIGEVGQPGFWNDVRVSGLEFSTGYLAALAVAIPFGLATGWFRRLHYFFDPWLNAFNALPRIALLPLIVLWVGLGIWAKIVVVFLGVFFPVALNTFHGVRTVDRNLLAVASSFGSNRRHLFLTIVLPATVPFALTGARLGVGRAVAGVVVGEFYTAEAGLAHRMFKAGQVLETDRLLFGALVITLLALGVFKCVSVIEQRFSHWRPAVRDSKR